MIILEPRVLVTLADSALHRTLTVYQPSASFGIWEILDKWVMPLFLGFVGAVIGLFVLQWLKLRYNRCKLKLSARARTEDTLNLRVHNSGMFPITDAYVYVSIKHKKGDVEDAKSLQRPIGSSHITPRAFVIPGSAEQVSDDRMIWSLEVDGSHPVKLDIHPDEEQAVSFLAFWKTFLEVSSEQGFSFNELPGSSPTNRKFAACRVILKNQTYEFLIKVVTAESLPAYWHVTYDPSRGNSPIKIENDGKKLTRKKVKRLRDEFKNHWLNIKLPLSCAKASSSQSLLPLH